MFATINETELVLKTKNKLKNLLLVYLKFTFYVNPKKYIKDLITKVLFLKTTFASNFLMKTFCNEK